MPTKHQLCELGDHLLGAAIFLVVAIVIALLVLVAAETAKIALMGASLTFILSVALYIVITTAKALDLRSIRENH